MNKRVKSCQRRALISLAIVVIVLSGCASPNAKGKHSRIVDEEVYIDFKHRFSMVLPVTWQRAKTPVSLPAYHPDTVQWIISEADDRIGSLQVITQSPSIKPTLQESLSAFLNSQAKLIERETEAFQHPAGSALRLNGKDSFGNVIYLPIKGLDQTYIIAFKIKETDYEQLLPMIEKIILSFSIL